MSMKARDLRKLAWDDLTAGQYWPFVGGNFVMGLIVGIIYVVGVVAMLAAVVIAVGITGGLENFTSLMSDPASLLVNPIPLAVILVGTLVACIPFFYGYGYGGWGGARMALAAANREHRFELCLSGWGHGWKMCWTQLVQLTYVQLWGLLLIVPGIVKWFSYAMTPLVQVEHPDWDADQCITESRRLMDGNKWRYFCLNLSFAWWWMLYVVIMMIPFVGNLLGTIAQYLLTPYVMTAQAEFYKTVKEEKGPAEVPPRGRSQLLVSLVLLLGILLAGVATVTVAAWLGDRAASSDSYEVEECDDCDSL